MLPSTRMIQYLAHESLKRVENWLNFAFFSNALWASFPGTPNQTCTVSEQEEEEDSQSYFLKNLCNSLPTHFVSKAAVSETGEWFMPLGPWQNCFKKTYTFLIAQRRQQQLSETTLDSFRAVSNYAETEFFVFPLFFFYNLIFLPISGMFSHTYFA